MVILFVFLATPVVVVAVLSFASDKILVFPPSGWGFRQYRAFVESEVWRSSLLLSVEIAAVAAALALVVGALLVYAVHRIGLPGSGVLHVLGVSPLVIPRIAYALALYAVFAQFHITGRAVGLILAHAALGLPFVVLVLGPVMSRSPEQYEFVAMSLGASRMRAVVGVTFRLVLPGVVGAYILAFVVSFDDTVFAVFLGGPELTTLPKAIYSSLRTGLDPAITAVSTVLMLGTAVLLGVGMNVRRSSDSVG